MVPWPFLGLGQILPRSICLANSPSASETFREILQRFERFYHVEAVCSLLLCSFELLP